MIAVIFEFQPHADRRSEYQQLAAELHLELKQIDGFLSIERYQSLTDPDKILSLSYWRDEEAVRNWRCHDQHREAQRAGRRDLFASYRLRVAGVIRDYSHDDRAGAPADSQRLHG